MSTQRLTGKHLWVGFEDAAGTVTLSGDQTAFDTTFEQETVDASAGGDTTRVYLPTLRNFSAKLESFYRGASGMADLARVAPGDAGTLLWGPEGSGEGSPKWGIPAIVTRADYSFPFDNLAKVTLEFQPQGDLIFDGSSDTF